MIDTENSIFGMGMAETLADAAGARYVKLWIPGLSWIKGRNEKISVFFEFARHGRALTGVSPEHAQIVGSV